MGACASFAAIVAYYLLRFRDALLTFFWADDFVLMRFAAPLHFTSFADLGQLLHPIHTGFLLYRPLTSVAYFYALRQLFGYDASGYHAIQLLAHAINALLVLGIARRLTDSPLAALSAAILYAAAPGHIAAIYWVSAFTMTGTAIVVLAMLSVWLRTASAWRGVACTILQAIGLLCSEHAVAAPLLLALLALLGPRREPARAVRRDLAVPSLLVAVYLGCKAYYLLHAPFRSLPALSYTPHFDPLSWPRSLGHYAKACVNLASLVHTGPTALATSGVLVIALAGLAIWQTTRGRREWRLLALGSSMFIASLLPVLPLRDHTFDYYIGIAAAGAALAALGVCQLVTRSWRGLAAALAVTVVLLDVATHGRAARANPHFQFIEAASDAEARWAVTVRRAAAAPGAARDIEAPNDILTRFLFAPLGARGLFVELPLVRLYDPAHPPLPAPGRLVLHEPIAALAPGERLPGWQPRWDWLRRLAGLRMQ